MNEQEKRKYKVKFDYSGGSCSSNFSIDNIENWVDEISKYNMLTIHGDPTLVINIKNVNSISITELDK